MAFDMESLAEATSGAIGALVSTTILYPLDTCKTKYQAEVRAHNQQKYRKLSDVLWEAISTHRVLSLYQGLGTKNLQSFISQFIYFYGYSFFKRLYVQKSGLKSIGTTANLFVAAAAGAFTVVIIQESKYYIHNLQGKRTGVMQKLLNKFHVVPVAGLLPAQPLDTASSRMQTSEFGKSKGLLKTLSECTWREAFDGLGISLLLTANPSIQDSISGIKESHPGGFKLKYTVFDQLKLRLLKGQSSKGGSKLSPQALSAFSAFLLGAVSKCVATCLTYPAIRCKVMIQSAESDEDMNDEAQLKSRKTVSGALYAIWKGEGLLGFYKGLQAQILKTVLSSALLLMIKEKITKTTWVLMLALQRHLFITRSRLKKS
ncbi:hypothetical protein RJ640_011345 [Escallonia rubra]|uniref:Peroxisomal adenine nucleotide carrier 1 n=1 Tax=Escallonia rubra TaxID=112253 RepID=A0AA88U2E0_9ASTE|nr:hypothetical protein RJ640_011345 [Escallonia rubra]